MTSLYKGTFAEPLGASQCTQGKTLCRGVSSSSYREGGLAKPSEALQCIQGKPSCRGGFIKPLNSGDIAKPVGTSWNTQTKPPYRGGIKAPKECLYVEGALHIRMGLCEAPKHGDLWSPYTEGASASL